MSCHHISADIDLTWGSAFLLRLPTSLLSAHLPLLTLPANHTHIDVRDRLNNIPALSAVWSGFTPHYNCSHRSHRSSSTDLRSSRARRDGAKELDCLRPSTNALLMYISNLSPDHILDHLDCGGASAREIQDVAAALGCEGAISVIVEYWSMLQRSARGDTLLEGHRSRRRALNHHGYHASSEDEDDEDEDERWRQGWNENDLEEVWRPVNGGGNGAGGRFEAHLARTAPELLPTWHERFKGVFLAIDGGVEGLQRMLRAWGEGESTVVVPPGAAAEGGVLTGDSGEGRRAVIEIRLANTTCTRSDRSGRRSEVLEDDQRLKRKIVEWLRGSGEPLRRRVGARRERYLEGAGRRGAL